MKAEFWHARWELNQIGFHQSAINVHLQQFWEQVPAPPGSTVFVPLCGKSSDMLWLRAQGHPVLGVELSPVAVRDFFAENGLEPRISQVGAFERWEHDGLVILLGDFFALTVDDVAECGAVFDRASLIALPPDMRPAYAMHMHTLFPTPRPTLLVTIEYDQSIAGGPPFSVAAAEVRGYYAERHQIEVLQTLDVLDDLPGLKKRGVPAITETAWLLTDLRAQ
ncbi:MAG: thiopurine S-methyltransferase [Thiolinea sp.]